MNDVPGRVCSLASGDVTPLPHTTWSSPEIGYLDKLPKDPWGRDYQYSKPGIHNKKSFDVFSLGPDGKKSDDDIGNW